MLRATGLGVVGLVGLSLVGAAGFAAWLATDAGSRWTERRAESLVNGLMTEGSASLRHVRIDMRGGILVQGLSLRDPSDLEVVRVEQAVLSFDPWALLSWRVKGHHLRAEGVYVDLATDDDGVLALSRMFGGPSESTEPWAGMPIDVDMTQVDLQGAEVRYRTPQGVVAHAIGLNATAALTAVGTRIEVVQLHIDGVVAAPGALPVALRGGVVYNNGALTLDDVVVRAPGTAIETSGTLDRKLDLEVRVLRADLSHIDPLVGAGLTGTFDGSARVSGPIEDMRLVVTLDGTKETTGGVRLRLGGDLSGERWIWNAKGELHDLHVDHFLTSLKEPIALDGDIDLAGAGLAWPDDLSITGRWTGGEQHIVGQTLAAVDVAFAIREGVVFVHEGTTIEGIVGTIEPDGWYDVTSGLLDMGAIGTLTPKELATLGVKGFRTPGTYDVRLIGATDGVDPLHIKGQARFDRGFAYDEIRASRLVADFGLDLRGRRVTGDIRLNGSGVDAYGLKANSLTTQGLQLDVVPDGETTVDGPLMLTGVVYDPVITAEFAQVNLSVASGKVLRTDADIALGPYTFLQQPGTEGLARIKLFDNLLDFDVGLTDMQRPEFRALGRFRLDDKTVDLAALDWSPTPRIELGLARPAHMRVSDAGGIVDAQVSLTSGLGDVTLTGEVGASGPLNAEVVASKVQLDVLSELFPDQFTGLSGTAAATVRLSGTAEEPIAQVGLGIDDLYFDGAVRYLDVKGGALWSNNVLEPDVSVSVVDVPFLEITGGLPLVGSLTSAGIDPKGITDLTIAMRPGAVARIAQAAPAVEESKLPTGNISAVVHIRGPWENPDLHTAGVAELDIRGWRQQGRVEFDVTREAESLSFWSDLREGFAQRANLGGGGLTQVGDVWSWAVLGEEKPNLEDYTLWLDQMFVSGVLLGVPANSLLAMSDLQLQATGEIVGGVSVSGSPYLPVVEGGVHWLDASLQGTSFEGAYASISPGESAYNMELQLDFPGQGGFAIKGPVPVIADLRKPWQEWGTGDLDLVIDGEGLPLSLLQVVSPDISKAVGLVAVDGVVKGTLSNPRPVVNLHHQEGSAQFGPLGLTLTEITAEITADKDHVALNVSGVPEPRRKLGAGAVTEVGQTPRIRATGEATLKDWLLDGIAVSVKFQDGAWLSATDDLVLRTDGQLSLTGNWPAVKVGGDLELVNGEATLDVASFIDTAPLELDPRMTVVRKESRREKVTTEPEPPFYSDFIVNVGVNLKRNLQVNVAMPFIDDLGSLGAAVTRLDVSSRLGGDLRATLTDGNLDLVGEVEVIEGKARVLRSSFELNSGSVAFTGGDPFNPILDLSATMDLKDADLVMRVNGTPEKPDISFTSEQYPDPTQVMTILLTGRAPSDLDSNQGEGTAEALAQLLLNSLFAGQSLGSFSIEPDGSVRLGVPISQAVYASSTLAATQNPTENRLSVGLEWSLLPKVVASGAVGDRRSSADVYWEIRF